jgi:carbon-monoxide dehydrogenase small subunit
MSEGQVALTLTLNGTARSAEIDPRLLLVEALRDAFGLTGPKIGCLTGDCGACTVRLDGAIVKSCLVLAVAVDGAEIVTIEGLATNGELNELQRAFWDDYAFQCGYCLSGMLFSAQDLLERNPDPTDAEIRTAIDGTLCRCTGYETIVTAVKQAGRLLREATQAPT